MRSSQYVHRSDDGRGIRRVFVNEVEVKLAMMADTRRGVVEVLRSPGRLDKHGKRLLTRRIYGSVRVEFVGTFAGSSIAAP